MFEFYFLNKVTEHVIGNSFLFVVIVILGILFLFFDNFISPYK